MASIRFGPVVLDRGYDDWLGELAREAWLSRQFDDFGRFARNPVQPRNPAITPISGATPPLVPVPVPSPTPGFPGTLPPSPVPGFPGGAGGTIPDRIPGRPAAGLAGFLGSILRGGWIGALFYPSANPGGASSALCIETQYGPWCPPGLPNVAAPAPGVLAPGRGRRRPRAVPAAPGRRRRAARPIAQPIGPPRPRGRPVTLTRPRVETRPDVAVIARSPASSPAPPPVPASIPEAQTVSLPGTIAAPSPAVVPAARAAPIPAIAGLVLPALGAWLTGISAPIVGAIAGPIVGPIVGPIPTPIGGPIVGPSPAVRPLPSPLTAFSAAPATSASRDLDEQCRARARQRRKKRKPREVCYRGTYVEKRNGTIKRRKEKVRCQ